MVAFGTTPSSLLAADCTASSKLIVGVQVAIELRKADRGPERELIKDEPVRGSAKNGNRCCAVLPHTCDISDDD